MIVIIARLGIIAELGQVITGCETGQVITALEKEGAHEIDDILLLESEEDIEGRKDFLLFSLYFLLLFRVKATFSASGTPTAISTSEKNIGIQSEPYIILIVSIRMEVSS